MRESLAATVLLAAACSIAPAAFGQQPGAGATTSAEGIDAATLAKPRQRSRTDRRSLAAQDLPLNEAGAVAGAFWPAHERCHASIDAAHAGPTARSSTTSARTGG